METKNGRVIFPNMEEWEMTDNDNYQFCRMINEHEFEYIQLSNAHVINLLEERLDTKELDVPLKVKVFSLISNAKEYYTDTDDWYHGEIDVNDYTDDEIMGYLSAYSGILDGCNTDKERNQLIAECIFETDMYTDFNPMYY